MQTLIFSIFLLSISLFSFSQNYSRVKVFGTQEELSKLGNLGVAMDHGIRKEGLFFISDFSKDEIAIMQTYGYDYEILIADVEKYYIDILNNFS